MMNRGAMVRVLMVAGIVLAFVAGHRVAKSSAGVPGRDTDSEKNKTTDFEVEFKESLTRSVAAARSWQEVKTRVVTRWEASPAVLVDFELLDETMRLLEKIPTSDLAPWRRELRALEQDYTDYDRDVPLLLSEMILRILAQREGGDFIQSLAATTEDDGVGDMEDAMAHWMKHDPAAALDWLDGQVPGVIAEEVDDYREEALECLAEKDLLEFEKRLSQVSAEVREEVLEDYASLKGTSEERAGLLARAAGSPHGEAMALWTGLIRHEGDEDPTRAYATLAELDISPEDRAELDERLMFWLLYPDSFSREKIDGVGVMRAWVMRNPGDGVSESILESFGRWSGSDPDQAMAWIAELPSGDRYDAFAKTLIEERIGKHETAAGVIERIDDGEIRVAMQRQLKESWLRSDADAAAEWELGLPEEERGRLK